METTFDLELNEISPSLFMLPWIGPNYKNTQLLFLGESEYDDGTLFHKNWKREWIQNERILDTKKDSRLINKIDETILRKNIDSDNQRKLWNAIAYTNLVQRPMDWNESKEDKPNDDDLLLGWETILKALLVLKPKYIIKWGILGDGTLRGNVFKQKYLGWEYEDIDGDRFLSLKHSSGFETKILFVHHPSWRFFNASDTSERIFNSLPELDKIITSL